MLTSCLCPVASIFRLLHSARRPAISRGRLRAGRSWVRRGEAYSEGPVMCRRRTWWEPRERFLRAMNWTDRGAAMVSGSSLAMRVDDKVGVRVSWRRERVCRWRMSMLYRVRHETFQLWHEESRSKRGGERMGKVLGLLKLSMLRRYYVCTSTYVVRTDLLSIGWGWMGTDGATAASDRFTECRG